jgi:hypothetical protein
LAGVAVIISVAGCTKVTPGALQTDSKSVELGVAKSANVEINMGAGELSVAGGASDLMKASFTYNVASWKPEVTYSVKDDHATLRIEQPDINDGFDISGNGVRNEWAVTLNDSVPVDLTTNLGAGVSRLDVSKLSLRSLNVNGGAGEDTVNLAGDYKHDFTANIRVGVGRTTVRLPRNVGVKVEVSNGIGSVEAPGLRANGNSYENDAYGKSDTTVHVNIHKGVGEVILESSDEAAR